MVKNIEDFLLKIRVRKRMKTLTTLVGSAGSSSQYSKARKRKLKE
jgi:hypothetical protein